MRSLDMLAVVLLASILLAVDFSLGEKLFSTTSDANSSPDSQDTIKLLLTILENHSSGLPRELVQKLSFLRSLPPDVLQLAMESYLPTILRDQLSGGKGDQPIGADNFLNVARGLSQGLKPWADKFKEIAPTIQELVEREEERGTTGEDHQEVKKDEMKIKNESFCQHLNNVCYLDTPFNCYS